MGFRINLDLGKIEALYTREIFKQVVNYLNTYFVNEAAISYSSLINNVTSNDERINTIENSTAFTGPFSGSYTDLTNVPTDFTPSTHAHNYADLLNVPLVFTPTTHGHDYSELTNVPTEFLPSAHGHDYLELTNVPASFTPSVHAHSYNDLADIPADFTPSTHIHNYSNIANVPTEFTPSAHVHDYSTLTSIPSEFNPTAHGHDYSELTNVPATFAPSEHSHEEFIGTSEKAKFRNLLKSLDVNTNTIVWMGDSITEQGRVGVGVGNEIGYTTYLEAKYPNAIYNNQGVGGFTTKDLITNIATYTAIGADMYVVAIGVNDARYNDTRGAANDAEYLANITSIYNSLKVVTTNLAFISIWPTYDADAFAALGRIATDQRFVEWNKILKDFCETNNVIFINAYDQVKATITPHNEGTLASDGVHPNINDTEAKEIYANCVLYDDYVRAKYSDVTATMNSNIARLDLLELLPSETAASHGDNYNMQIAWNGNLQSGDLQFDIFNTNLRMGYSNVAQSNFVSFKKPVGVANLLIESGDNYAGIKILEKSGALNDRAFWMYSAWGSMYFTCRTDTFGSKGGADIRIEHNSRKIVMGESGGKVVVGPNMTPYQTFNVNGSTNLGGDVYLSQANLKGGLLKTSDTGLLEKIAWPLPIMSGILALNVTGTTEYNIFPSAGITINVTGNGKVRIQLLLDPAYGPSQIHTSGGYGEWIIHLNDVAYTSIKFEGYTPKLEAVLTSIPQGNQVFKAYMKGELAGTNIAITGARASVDEYF